MGGNLHNLTVGDLRDLLRRIVDGTLRHSVGDKIPAVFKSDENRELRAQVVRSMRKFLPDSGDDDENASPE